MQKRFMQTPNEIGLPYSDWREGQIEAIAWIEKDDWLRSQGSEKVKVIEAPTGTGKTGLILALSAMNPELRILVLCATKLEQAQYEKNITDEYEGFALIKGRNNFHCRLERENATEECNTSPCYDIHVDQAKCSVAGEFECPMVSECTYFNQLTDISSKRIVVTNYAYGLTMLNYVKGRLGEFDLIVEDEGHVLDSMLEQFIEVRINRRHMKDVCNLSTPSYQTVPQWQRWCEDNQLNINRAYRETHLYAPKDMSEKELKTAKRTEDIVGSFKQIKDMNVDWVVEPDEFSVPFMPIWVTQDSEGVLFNHANKHIIMSGTIPSALELTKKVGIPAKNFQFYRMPYVFPPEHREIIIRPVALMSAKHIDTNLPVMTREIDRILDKNLDKKILIHTVNYKVARYIKNSSIFSQHMYTHTSRDRLNVLMDFKKASAPAILISPSFDKAVDLPDEECELTIVAKLPFPYLGSKVMQARVKQNRRYYDNETLSTLIQMAGRGVRSETDICPTIVLDASVTAFLKRCRTSGLVPQGIEEAIRGEE
jgi:Rad3-related DNA helicase